MSLQSIKNKTYFGLILALLLAADVQVSFSQEFSLVPGEKVVLRTEVFQSDSDTLDQPMINALKSIGEYMQKRPELRIEIGGHSDSTGTPDYNDDLAQRRANRVRDYLVNNFSVSAKNIVAKGFGSRYPLASNETPEGRAQNRRIEIMPLTALTNRPLTSGTNKATNEEGVLSFFNGAVQTKAPWDIGFGDAFLSEPIYEMHKINTRTESRAEVTFNDESRLQVGENSLVIVYGLESRQPAIKEKGNVELVKGNLLAKLKALEQKNQYVLKTPGAQMSFNSDSKSRIAVDKAERSTVSMFEGKTKVSAGGASVEVPENFGTQIIKDAPPDPPRLLPDPPVVITPDKEFASWSKEGVTFAWKSTSYAAKLEISTDTNFNNLVWSVNTRRYLSKVNLQDGVYYWHIQGVDSLGLEGRPSPTRVLRVKKYDYDRAKLDFPSYTDEILTVNDEEVIISGKADPHSIVRINSERLLLEQTGEFSKAVHLREGRNTFVVEARDTAGFENSKTLIYDYQPSRRFGLTLGFSPLVFPNKYGSLKAGGDISIKLPQLFASDVNFGISLTVGEFVLSKLSADTFQVNSKTPIRPYGFAEFLLTIEGSREKAIVPFVEISSGAFMWPKYRGDYYSTASGIAYTAGLGAGIRSNGVSSAWGISGVYHWITNDYQRFDPYAHKGIHGMLDLQISYYMY